MTSVFKECKPGHHLRTPETDITLTLDPSSSRILSFQRTSTHKRIRIPVSNFQERPTVQLRGDLMETHIHICSPEVLSTFADDFDFQQLDDLIRTALEGDGIRDYRLYSHILTAEYAARVSNLHTFQAISQDMILRWSFPVVPDMYRSSGQPTSYKRNQVYIDESVRLSRGSTLEERVIIGSGSRVGTDGKSPSTITRSVIGRNCIIGAGVHIENSHLWDNVEIGDGCVVSNSILANDVSLKAGVIIGQNCIIGANVCLGPNVKVPPLSTFSMHIQDQDQEDDEPQTREVPPAHSGPVFDQQSVGCEGKGHLWENEVSQQWALSKQVSIASVANESDSESSDSESSDGNDNTHVVLDDFAVFYDEVLGLVSERVVQVSVESLQLDNIALEISGARSAHYMSPRDTAHAFLKALVASSDAGLSTKDLGGYFKKIFQKLSAIIKNYVKVEEDQLQAIAVLEDACISVQHCQPFLQTIMHVLYESDVLEEDAILKWYDAHDTSTDVKMKLHSQVKPLITWLRTADEEDDEDDSDDD